MDARRQGAGTGDALVGGDRRWVAVAAAFALVLVGVGAHAPRDARTVSGTVLVEAANAHVAACAWRTGRADSQGLLGWVVRLTPREGDGWHGYRLSSHAPGQPAPLDVTFFARLGTCDSPGEVLDHDPDPGSSPFLSGTRDGWVPEGARYAVIGRWSLDTAWYYTGQVRVSGVGVAAPFRFTVSDPPPWWSS